MKKLTLSNSFNDLQLSILTKEQMRNIKGGVAAPQLPYGICGSNQDGENCTVDLCTDDGQPYECDVPVPCDALSEL